MAENTTEIFLETNSKQICLTEAWLPLLYSVCLFTATLNNSSCTVYGDKPSTPVLMCSCVKEQTLGQNHSMTGTHTAGWQLLACHLRAMNAVLPTKSNLSKIYLHLRPLISSMCFVKTPVQIYTKHSAQACYAHEKSRQNTNDSKSPNQKENVNKPPYPFTNKKTVVST